MFGLLFIWVLKNKKKLFSKLTFIMSDERWDSWGCDGICGHGVPLDRLVVKFGQNATMNGTRLYRNTFFITTPVRVNSPSRIEVRSRLPSSANFARQFTEMRFRIPILLHHEI